MSENSLQKYRFQLLKFFLCHMFIPTSAVVFVTISSAWKLKFFGGYCFELCTCVRFSRLLVVLVLVLELWSWLQDCYKFTISVRLAASINQPRPFSTKILWYKSQIFLKNVQKTCAVAHGTCGTRNNKCWYQLVHSNDWSEYPLRARHLNDTQTHKIYTH